LGSCGITQYQAFSPGDAETKRGLLTLEERLAQYSSGSANRCWARAAVHAEAGGAFILAAVGILAPLTLPACRVFAEKTIVKKTKTSSLYDQPSKPSRDEASVHRLA
jgi:hypothetical protein